MTATGGPGAGATPRSPSFPPPVFVLAPARSCSSVVVSMLGGHPGLYAFPELRLFRAARVTGLLADPPPGRGMPARERTAGLLRALAQLQEGSQSAGAVDRSWRWLQDRGSWEVSRVMDRLLELVGPLVGVEKSPETSLSWEALTRVRTAYPQARYVHLTRHPWTTVTSMVAAWSGLAYWDVDRAAAAEHCATVWLEQHRRISAFTSQLDPRQHLRVRAEDVVNRPESVLPPICRRLAVAEDPASLELMAAPERSPYARPGPVNAWGGLDPAFLRQPHRRRVGTPATLWPPTSLRIGGPTAQAVAELAQEFGYHAGDRARVMPSPSRLRTLDRHRMIDRTTRRRHA